MRPNTIEGIRARLVEGPGGCLEWPGHKRMGYGQVQIRRRQWQVHRLLWEAEHGPIRAGMVPDHLCRNRACANLDHLEIVTNRENILRGQGATAQHYRKTHCNRGHEFTPDNTRITREGGRRCWTCRKAYMAEYHRNRVRVRSKRSRSGGSIHGK